MKNLSCFGSYDGDNNQCIRCNDSDCQKIYEERMNLDDWTIESSDCPDFGVGFVEV